MQSRVLVVSIALANSHRKGVCWAERAQVTDRVGNVKNQQVNGQGLRRLNTVVPRRWYHEKPQPDQLTVPSPSGLCLRSHRWSKTAKTWCPMSFHSSQTKVAPTPDKVSPSGKQKNKISVTRDSHKFYSSCLEFLVLASSLVVADVGLCIDPLGSHLQCGQKKTIQLYLCGSHFL